jgi:hypothetical protein
MFFLALNISYFFFLTIPALAIHPSLDNQFYYEINLSDHNFYKSLIINKSALDSQLFSLNNNWGISLFYEELLKFLNFGIEELTGIVFIVNNLVLFLCFLIFNKIRGMFSLSLNYNILFLFNPALIYFSQVIYKEPFSLLLFLLSIYLTLKRSWFYLILLLPIGYLIRFQLVFFLLLMLFFYNRKNLKPKFLILILSFLVTGTAYSIFYKDHAFSPSSSFGFVELYQFLNKNYLIGTIVLTPIRLLQYLHDLSLSAFFIQTDGIDLFRLRDFPFFLLLIFNSTKFCRFFSESENFNNRNFILFSSVCFFILILLINPIIHSRYLFPIFPVFILILGLENKRGSNLKESFKSIGPLDPEFFVEMRKRVKLILFFYLLVFFPFLRMGIQEWQKSNEIGFKYSSYISIPFYKGSEFNSFDGMDVPISVIEKIKNVTIPSLIIESNNSYFSRFTVEQVSSSNLIRIFSYSSLDENTEEIVKMHSIMIEGILKGAKRNTCEQEKCFAEGFTYFHQSLTLEALALKSESPEQVNKTKNPFLLIGIGIFLSLIIVILLFFFILNIFNFFKVSKEIV